MDKIVPTNVPAEIVQKEQAGPIERYLDGLVAFLNHSRASSVGAGRLLGASSIYDGLQVEDTTVKDPASPERWKPATKDDLGLKPERAGAWAGALKKPTPSADDLELLAARTRMAQAVESYGQEKRDGGQEMGIAEEG